MTSGTSHLGTRARPASSAPFSRFFHESSYPQGAEHVVVLLPEDVHHLCPVSLGLAGAFVSILAVQPLAPLHMRLSVKGAYSPPPSREEIAQRRSISSVHQAQQKLDAEPVSGQSHVEAKT